MDAAIISLLTLGFTTVLTALGFLARRVVNQIDNNTTGLAKLDVRVAVVETDLKAHEAAHMLSGHRLDKIDPNII